MIFSFHQNRNLPNSEVYLVMPQDYHMYTNRNPFELLEMIKSAFPNQAAYVGCYGQYENCVVLSA